MLAWLSLEGDNRRVIGLYDGLEASEEGFGGVLRRLCFTCIERWVKVWLRPFRAGGDLGWAGLVLWWLMDKAMDLLRATLKCFSISPARRSLALAPNLCL